MGDAMLLTQQPRTEVSLWPSLATAHVCMWCVSYDTDDTGHSFLNSEHFLLESILSNNGGQHQQPWSLLAVPSRAHNDNQWLHSLPAFWSSKWAWLLILPKCWPYVWGKLRFMWFATMTWVSCGDHLEADQRDVPG